jgi:hypothetical protein
MFAELSVAVSYVHNSVYWSAEPSVEFPNDVFLVWLSVFIPYFFVEQRLSFHSKVTDDLGRRKKVQNKLG